MIGAVQPADEPCETKNVTQMSPIESTAAPHQSMRPAETGFAVLGTTSSTQARATSPTRKITTKIDRKPKVSASRPPK